MRGRRVGMARGGAGGLFSFLFFECAAAAPSLSARRCLVSLCAWVPCGRNAWEWLIRNIPAGTVASAVGGELWPRALHPVDPPPPPVAALGHSTNVLCPCLLGVCRHSRDAGVCRELPACSRTQRIMCAALGVPRSIVLRAIATVDQ